MKFTRTNLMLLVLCIASLIFLLDGGRRALNGSCDFVPVYTGARCLLHGCNPYDTSQLNQQYFQSGGRAEELLPWPYEMPMYPPSTLLVLSPLALLRYQVARLLWFLLNGSLFVTSAGLVLSMCPRSHRWIAIALVSLILATSRVQLGVGQPSISAISLLVIGFYFFQRGRYLPLSTFLLMVSLAIKPQIGCLIVLFLLARGIHRRYAVASVAGALVFFLFAGLILRMHPSSADWPSSLHENMSTTFEAGGVNDPGPANPYANLSVNLQPVTNVLLADPKEVNAAAYAIFLAFLAVLVTTVLRTNASPDVHLLSIGALAVLTLMPSYHRWYDNRILLITIPAIVIVYQKRRLLGAFIGALTALIIYSVPIQVRVQMFLQHQSMWQNVLQNKFLFILLLRQQNLELLLLFGLYLVAFASFRIPSTQTSDSSARHARFSTQG